MIRRISWIKAAHKTFTQFPIDAQDQIMTALRLAATGRKSQLAKPLKGFGSGMLEIALPYRGRCISDDLCDSTWGRRMGHPCI